jgi:UDP-glucose 4-epimerase
VPRRVLITGGAGFIGSHLARELVRRGFEVRSLDRRARDVAVAGVDDRLGDVLDPRALALSLEGVEAVFHLAADVSVPLCEERPEETDRNNVQATAQVYAAAAHESLKQGGQPVRMIFASSAAVYGAAGNAGQPIAETLELDRPLSRYGVQKLEAERILRSAPQGSFEGARVPRVVFRFFNVYGPGQDPSSPYSGVISRFADRATQGQELAIYGDGLQTRDFVAVSDIVGALVASLDLSPEASDGRPVNLGSGRAVSVLELAQQMIHLSGAGSQLRMAEPRAGDIQHSLASIDRARELLGWEPQIRLQAGLRELLRGVI